MKVLRSWYQHNSITIQGRIKVGKTTLLTVRKENVPEPEELRRILAQAENRRVRVGIAMMAYGGVRPEVLGDADGVDGLKVGDFPEMEYTNEKTAIVTVKGKSRLKVIQRGAVTFTKMPTAFIVRDSLSKMGNEYCGFLSKEGCDYLKDYLEERMKTQKVFNGETKRREWRPGERLAPTDPLLRSDYLVSDLTDMAPAAHALNLEYGDGRRRIWGVWFMATFPVSMWCRGVRFGDR